MPRGAGAIRPTTRASGHVAGCLLTATLGGHALFAMLRFVGGGLAAIVTARATRPPFRYLSIALGVISLGSLLSYVLMGEGTPPRPLGMGGVERWVAYPIVIWVTGFGGYLSART